MANLFRTLGELARCKGILIVHCRDCGRGAIKDAADLAHSGVPERHIDSLRYKCAACGSRRTLAYPYLPATHEALERAVHGELELSGGGIAGLS